MTVFKFLFVLALAVPLAVFMWNYINKLSDEFQQSVARGKGSSAEQGNPQPAPKKKGRKPAGVGRKKGSGRTAGEAQRASRQTRPQGREYGAPEGYAFGHEQRQVPEHYQQLRSNFENSRMKQRYEESKRQSSAQPKSQGRAEQAERPVRMEKTVKRENKPESKRARRKARKKERELRNRETRR